MCYSFLFFLSFFFIIRRWVIAPFDNTGVIGPISAAMEMTHIRTVAGRCPLLCERPLHAKCETVRFEIRAQWIGEARSSSFPTSTHRQFWSERSRVEWGWRGEGEGEGEESRRSSGSGKREMGRESRSVQRGVCETVTWERSRGQVDRRSSIPFR